MKRQKMTGLPPPGDQRLQDLNRRFQFRIGRSCQAFGSRHKARERSRFLQSGRRLDIERVRLVGLVVEDLLLEPIGIGGETVTKRAERSGRGRADAAISANVPQNASRRRRWSGPAPSTTPKQ
jgi:hypothetical protein